MCLILVGLLFLKTVKQKKNDNPLTIPSKRRNCVICPPQPLPLVLLQLPVLYFGNRDCGI